MPGRVGTTLPAAVIFDYRHLGKGPCAIGAITDKRPLLVPLMFLSPPAKSPLFTLLQCGSFLLQQQGRRYNMGVHSCRQLFWEGVPPFFWHMSLGGNKTPPGMGIAFGVGGSGRGVNMVWVCREKISHLTRTLALAGTPLVQGILWPGVLIEQMLASCSVHSITPSHFPDGSCIKRPGFPAELYTTALFPRNWHPPALFAPPTRESSIVDLHQHQSLWLQVQLERL